MEKRLNIGCGGRPLENYINIDQDSMSTLKQRYPEQKFPDVEIYDYDIFNLPFADNEVQEIKTDSLIEHLSFEEEPKIFYEVQRVLKPGGLFEFETPNFEKVVCLWLDAVDNWKEFYRNDDEAIKQEHWFGNNSYTTDNRWGYLSAIIFGSQNGLGQYHKNCYTIPKLKNILNYLNFDVLDITEFLWKEDRDPMIHIKSQKRFK
jgi:predicted SAM-dependent methyltransferase